MDILEFIATLEDVAWHKYERNLFPDDVRSVSTRAAVKVIEARPVCCG